MRCETIDPLSEERWQRFVDESANATIFHHRDWLRLLHDQYRYRMLACCVTDGGGEILAGLPLAQISSRLTGTRIVAVPFSDACAPLAREGGDRAALERLLEGIRAEHERSGIDMEIRAAIDGVGNSGARFHRHEVALQPGLDAVTARLSKLTRRSIARARSEGVQVVLATDRQALQSFYRLHVRTRRRQGVPTQPKRFIERFAALFERALGFVLLAHTGREPIAGGVFLSFNGVLTYKYGASERSQLHMRPNHAIFMEALRRGCEQGMHTLDLGRTDLSNEGLRAFKRGWGATEQELTYTRLARRAGGGPPPGAQRALGTLISHTPAVTGRLLGTALYRHFG